MVKHPSGVWALLVNGDPIVRADTQICGSGITQGEAAELLNIELQAAVRDADALTTQARSILRVVIDQLPPDLFPGHPALTANCLEAVSSLLVRVHQSLDKLPQCSTDAAELTALGL
jgi:hypothetical protein